MKMKRKAKFVIIKVESQKGEKFQILLRAGAKGRGHLLHWTDEIPASNENISHARTALRLIARDMGYEVI